MGGVSTAERFATAYLLAKPHRIIRTLPFQFDVLPEKLYPSQSRSVTARNRTEENGGKTIELGKTFATPGARHECLALVGAEKVPTARRRY